MTEPLHESASEEPKPSGSDALIGNQNARKYPKMPDEDDPVIEQQLARIHDGWIADRAEQQSSTDGE
jgi:hypothetical protein